MVVDILLDLIDATALVAPCRMSERAGSQDSGIIRYGQFIQNIEELQELYETLVFVGDIVQSRIDPHYRRKRKGKAMLGTPEHPLYGRELILGKQLVSEDITGELDGDLTYVLRPAVSLFPDMLEVGAPDQHQLIISYLFDAVTYDTPHPLSTFDEIELILLMAMERIGEFGLVTLYNVETVLV